MRNLVARAAATAALTALAVAPAVVQAPGGAQAGQPGRDPALTVTPDALPAGRISTVTVTGSGYLVPPHAPGVDVSGGVYVFFGWVADADQFGPSIRNSSNNDGTVGVTYAYPGAAGDASTRDNGNGNVRLVSFTGGGESGDATDFHMDDDGNWTTTMQVFGSTFTTTTPGGGSQSYDCLEVQCGVFTIGAHGVASATNERFAPITFEAGGAPVAPPPPPPPPAPGGGDSPESAGDPTGPAPQADTTEAPDLIPGEGSDPGSLTANADSVRSTGGVSPPVLITAAGLAAVLAAGVTGGLWWRRRRRETGAGPSATSVPQSEEGIQ